MAQVQVQALNRGYAVGATLGAYPRSNWPAAQPPKPGVAPIGAASGTNTVQSDGTVTITGLANATDYFVTDAASGIAYIACRTPGAGSDPAAVVEVSQVDGVVDVSDRAARLVGGVDQIKLGGTAIDTNSGVKSPGTQRIVLATDQPALSTPLPVDSELAAAVAASDSLANPTIPQMLAHLMVWDAFNTVWRRVGDATGGGDGISGGSFLQIANYLYASGNWDRQRGVNIVKTFASTAITAGTGATIWTPGAGKKFRVMGWAISSSVAGQILLGDNAAGTVIDRSPAVAAAGFFQKGAADMGNGILSAAANNVLKVDGPTGNVAGAVWGTEE